MADLVCNLCRWRVPACDLGKTLMVEHFKDKHPEHTLFEDPPHPTTQTFNALDEG